MKEILSTLIDIITIDIFIGYGLYSILYVLISIFKHPISFLRKLDLSANRLIIFSGVVYFLLTIITFLFFVDSDRSATVFLWIQPLLWTSISQLLWVKAIREKLWIRFLFAALFILSFHRFVIIATTLHRDYLPKSWFLFVIPTWEAVIGLIIKIIVFCILAISFSWAIEKVKGMKLNVSVRSKI